VLHAKDVVRITTGMQGTFCLHKKTGKLCSAPFYRKQYSSWHLHRKKDFGIPVDVDCTKTVARSILSFVPSSLDFLQKEQMPLFLPFTTTTAFLPLTLVRFTVPCSHGLSPTASTRLTGRQGVFVLALTVRLVLGF
jgi:hypothetical protein